MGLLCVRSYVCKNELIIIFISKSIKRVNALHFAFNKNEKYPFPALLSLYPFPSTCETKECSVC
jgi:hypothetical protein